MSSKDLKNNIAIEPTITAVTAGVTTTTGDPIDCQGYEGVTVELTCGLLVVGTLEIHESDASGSGFAAAAAADVIGTQLQAAVIDDVITLGYIGSKRYVKAVVVTTTGGIICSNVVLSHPHVAPTGLN